MASFCVKILIIAAFFYIIYVTGWLIAYEIIRIKYEKNIENTAQAAIAIITGIYFITWIGIMVAIRM